MDELSNWCEVIRSLLPQRYEVRMMWDSGAIAVGEPAAGKVVVLSAGSLAGRGPSEVVDSLRSQLRAAHAPYVRVA
jgi:hypothetical protein